MIELKSISYSYKMPTGNVAALSDISLNIQKGIMTAMIGKTGSGKTTLAELIAGIITPDTGTISGISEKNIGIVFQYPEYQLFEDTVFEDIAFAPKNLGLSGDDLKSRVKNAASIVGLGYELLQLAPFELSGGEKRLAAIAGVLAAEPEILILDEPAAGLDPTGKKRIFDILHQLLEDDPGMTVIFITHSMNDAAEHADELILLNDGTLAASGVPGDIFSDKALLSDCGIAPPDTVIIADMLRKSGIDTGKVYTEDELFTALCRVFEGRIDHMCRNRC